MKFKTEQKDKSKRNSKNYLTKGAFGKRKPHLNDGNFKVVPKSKRVTTETELKK